jgi:putative SOS response-associated peptidase YedK
MCYYNGIKVSHHQLVKLIGIEKAVAAFATQAKVLQSGFEYADYPILKPVDGGKDADLVMAHWELIPYWVKTREDLPEFRKKTNTLNAVGEEMFNRPTYKDAAAKRRCLILSSGFYEWRHYKPEGSKKVEKYPYYITVPEHPIFFMAGIYQPWTDKSTGETIDTFAIVTTKANALMEQVHNSKMRMPLILEGELAHEWIQDGLSKERVLEIVAHQYPSEKMKAQPIYKDFKGLDDPTVEYRYQELPELVGVGS